MSFKEHNCPIDDVCLENDEGVVICGCYEHAYLPKSVYDTLWEHVSEEDSIAVRKLAASFTDHQELVDIDQFMAVVEDPVSRITLKYMKIQFIKVALITAHLTMQAYLEIAELEEEE